MRYNSLNHYLVSKYNERVFKIALNGGMTCPNRDGTLDDRGCIFCSRGGSGDHAAPLSESVTSQIDNAITTLHKTKPGIRRFIAYFQAYTNTYAPVEYLERLFTEAIMHPDVVCLSIATRPDCLPAEVMELLKKLNNIKPVWVELGLQTIHEKTADHIRRHYTLDVYDDAVIRLKNAGLTIITHVIIGLPGETETDMLKTIKHIISLPLDGIKLQLLHVLKGTDLADEINDIHILTLEEYTDIIIHCLEIIPEHVIIHRVTGDAPRKLLIAPEWSLNKHGVLNRINHELKVRNTWQGRLI